MKCPACGFVIKERKKRQRSNQENSYLHGVVLPVLSEYTGYTPDEMKAVIKWKFKVKHTSDLTTIEFEHLMEDVRRWASAELGCNVPEPNEGKYD